MALCLVIGDGASASGFGCIAIGDGAVARGLFQIVVTTRLTLPQISSEQLPEVIAKIKDFQLTVAALSEQKVVTPEYFTRANKLIAKLIALLTPMDLMEDGGTTSGIVPGSGLSPAPEPSPEKIEVPVAAATPVSTVTVPTATRQVNFGE